MVPTNLEKKMVVCSIVLVRFYRRCRCLCCTEGNAEEIHLEAVPYCPRKMKSLAEDSFIRVRRS